MSFISYTASAVGKDYCAFDQHRLKITTDVDIKIIQLSDLCQNSEYSATLSFLSETLRAELKLSF